MKKTGRFIGWIATIFGLLSSIGAVVKIYSVFQSDGLKGVLLIVQTSYEKLFSPLFFVLEPLFLIIIERLKFLGISLVPQWREIFVLMMLYVLAHISHALIGGLPAPKRASAIRLLAGITAAFVACIVLSLSELNVNNDPGFVFSISCLLGFIIYRLIFAAQFAYDQSEFFDNRFWPQFLGKTVEGIFFVVICLIILFVAKKINIQGFWAIIVFIVTLGFFHLLIGSVAYRSLKQANVHSTQGLNGNLTIGIRILLTAILSTWLIAGSAIVGY